MTSGNLSSNVAHIAILRGQDKGIVYVEKDKESDEGLPTRELPAFVYSEPVGRQWNLDQSRARGRQRS